MGQPISKKTLLAKARSDAIDQQIMDDSVSFRREGKILLLGVGESGKSTIVKQMKIHHGGFNADELSEYRMTILFIYKNVLDSTNTLASVVRRVGIGALEESQRVHAMQLLAAFPVAPVQLTGVRLTHALADIIWHVAHIPAIKCLLENPTDFYLMDSALKWIHCFESVTSIFFCAALSEYDEYDEFLFEGWGWNRMRESFILFESVINSRWFLRTSVALFLTQIDVFNPLERHFPEYSGGNNLQKATKYILWRFMQENRARLSANDPRNILLVFAVAKETILQNALKDSGIL
ncbi:heterotrimeric G-protein alpha subunit, GPA3-like protein [Mycena rebaudengoi]|nr:heterotrimeric G-protein alpha subunit, GPA3-like protein [Mycena rebaudengoi]